MRTRFSIRRPVSERLALALLVTGLIALAAVPAATRAEGCSGDTAGSALPAVTPTGAWDAVDPQPTRGIDLEVRVLNLRIEFPWMKALPVTPGHHIVITMLSSRDQ